MNRKLTHFLMELKQRHFGGVVGNESFENAKSELETYMTENNLTANEVIISMLFLSNTAGSISISDNF